MYPCEGPEPDSRCAWSAKYNGDSELSVDRSFLIKLLPCNVTSTIHDEKRYSDSSVAWVLTAAIIVFFMKAGFMLVEIAFAKTPSERRTVVIYKYIDAFASALGFFLIGFDHLSKYESPQCLEPKFLEISDPVLWFFKFTFASNAATILGGCLVANTYKLRVPAVFVSAFVISGITHPLVAFFIWSNKCCETYSPYRFCEHLNCSQKCDFNDRAYVLDFAGGGAVHMLGGTAGLMICLFAKLQKWRDSRTPQNYVAYQVRVENNDATQEPEPAPQGFWDWMYPEMAGNENVEMAALGVIILWFSWFAFNCGSTESVESGRYGLYHAVPSRIAINMILSCAAGGTVSVAIACWAQLRYGTDSLNANEIANGILSCLVAITASCPFVSYWVACLIGIFAVIFYHFGCYAEYKLGIEDTARVVPVHGVCGLWSLIAVAAFVHEGLSQNLCYLHATFEGLCYCNLRLPYLSGGERLIAQVIGALVILALGIATGIVYGVLYVIPIQPFVTAIAKITCLNRKRHGVGLRKLKFHGGFLLTSPLDDFARRTIHKNLDETSTPDIPTTPTRLTRSIMPDYGATSMTSSLRGSAAELQQLPHANSSDHRRSSDSSQSSNTSSKQDIIAMSSSLPLLGRPVQTKVISRRNPHQRQHQNEDSTV